ncbi:MAG TPA: hypothetical protein PKA27_05140 [Fimbriimonadaceae bacterium]|nr:hypothetical protein [Fimbriimonadaceae bacterium]
MVVASVAGSQEPVQPAAELKKHDFYIGKWSGTIEWTMPGMEGKQEMTMVYSWEGPFMKATSEMTSNGQKILETGYMYWDAAKKQFTMNTYTNFAATPRIEHGKEEGNKLVMISEPWDIGMPTGALVSRSTLTKKSNSEVDFVLEFKMGDAFTKVAGATFKKK